MRKIIANTKTEQNIRISIIVNFFKKHFWNKPFQRAKIFQKAYLTDMIQELVDIGIKVHCVIIERGWKEIDTVEDYRKALIDFKR